ncbi:2-succinyl-6-hydroxy-2,4-cyclohexadiene-1-carboxylate synthase [Salinivibrio sp. ES.052]|uniref:2-succinyl-6-hydroxy-2, 4-cyclohexadiene-1-carboxylate synthase n=1 Tax=Salinivibrio sp. ES.052 TaxID=1882823 RepID=UPI00092A0897|nr:2-succinyl-6-hydroxy-2,4-cyclohexadiene-1-carboxylate synthase [Salinivibrio sp. ES.052]SIN76885.1 2-succinyl-6-hydroxy-2,4-cyclohexadiene-1-carboxylate synthase [Salinivibrio sp. ES.052]
MLGYQQGGNVEGRKVVFLHGLLGSGQDWQGVTSRLRDCHWLCIDLPGHGDSVDALGVDFTTTLDAVRQTCDHVWGNQSAYLVGYSLGARIAMHLAIAYPACWLGLFLEAGHPGLRHAHERHQRLAHDQAWAKRFGCEPLSAVLNDWYQQSVFQSLDAAQRAELITARGHNHGPAIAAMLDATSLGRQADLRTVLGNVCRQGLPIDYLCGEQDDKFISLAHSLLLTTGIPFTLIKGAGHNCHWADPSRFVQVLLEKCLLSA